MRRILVAGPLLVAFPLVAVLGGRFAAEQLGRRLGASAASAADALPRTARPALPPPLPPEPANPTLEASPQELAPAALTGKAAGPARRRSSTSRAAPARPPERGIFVSAGTVLGLADRGVIPRAVPVPATGARPAGLRLAGVGALGVGLRDGDVLTHVLGAPATSVASVIEQVVGARGRNARVISGKVWRDGHGFALVVEQPYVDQPSAPPGRPAPP